MTRAVARSFVGIGIVAALLAADPADKLPEPKKPNTVTPPAPTRAMPIDLPTALRLADENSPTIAVARARVDEAYARLQQAEVMWLPTLQTGVTYFRLDGRTQNQSGLMFSISRSNIFFSSGFGLRFDLANALYQPLAARQLSAAAEATARATSNNVQLDTALAYLDLLETYGRLAVNADTLSRAEETLRRANAADEAGLSRSKADVTRMRTEVELRRLERVEIEGRAGIASARLAQLTLLPPCVELQPVDVCVLPLTLVPPCPCEELVAVAVANRPEMAAFRAVTGAAAERLKQARVEPLLPRVSLDYAGGLYGGGRNDNLGEFSSRGTIGAALTWELRNLGLGNRAEIYERQAQLGVAGLRVREAQAQVSAEVAASAKVSEARLRSLSHAEAAVKEAVELYRRLLESSFGMTGAGGRLDTIEPLLAIQALNQARVQFLTSVIEYNRAQFRLHFALGQPACSALPGTARPLDVPAVPAVPATSDARATNGTKKE